MPNDLPPGWSTSHRRNNEEWLNELRGASGRFAQRRALEDLGNYLTVVIFNYLSQRAVTDRAVAGFSADEYVELAHDFTQDALEKLTRNHFALLNKFQAQGAFTSWMAQVSLRIVASELRRAYWRRRIHFPDPESEDADDAFATFVDPGAVEPALAALQRELGEEILDCLNRLSDRYRTVFLRCVEEEEQADVVAADLGTTTNAVYVIIYRAKRQLRRCLTRKGISLD